MKVVYVLDRFPVVSQTFVLNEIAELERRRVAVTICRRLASDPAEPSHREANGMIARTVGPAPGAGPAPLLRSLRETRASLAALRWTASASLAAPSRSRSLIEAAWFSEKVGEPDHIHSHFAWRASSVAVLMSRLLGVPFSFTAHAADVFRPDHERVFRLTAAEASFVAVPCEATARAVRSIAPAARVELVRMGIDVDAFTPARREPASTGTLTALSVARLVEKKGFDVLIAAAALLHTRCPGLRWRVIGEGPCREELERSVAAAGLAGVVSFDGHADSAVVRAAMRTADMFVLPCRVLADGDRDALPVSLIEAAAAGLPIVTTPVGGIPELVEDGSSGILVPPDDPQALAEAVATLESDPGLRERLGAGARAACAGYRREDTAARMLDLFAGRP